MQYQQAQAIIRQHFGPKARLETKFGKRKVLDEEGKVLGSGDSVRMAIQNALLPKILEANQTRENMQREFDKQLDAFAGFLQEKFKDEFEAYMKAKVKDEPAGD